MPGVNALNVERRGDDLVFSVSMQAKLLPRWIVDGTGNGGPDPTKEDDDYIEHGIIVPLLAIERRRLLYGLRSNLEAAAAIFREHSKRLNDLPDGSETLDPKLNRAGGLRPDVTVAVPPAVLTALAALGVVGAAGAGPP